MYSLGGLHRSGIEVAFSIHSGFLLCHGIARVYIVWWDGASNGTDARHGDFEQLCIKFLLKGKKHIYGQNRFVLVPLPPTHMYRRRVHELPCVPETQRFPRKACVTDAAPPPT